MTVPLTALVDAPSADGPVLVLLHGRGSHERDLAPLGPLLDPAATTVAVRAPFDAAPWGYGPGFAWYRFLGGTTPEDASFEAGQRDLAALIDDLPARLGRDRFHLIVGGFSQGATSAIAYLLRHPGRVDGVLMLSGFIPDHPTTRVTRERVGSTPIFWGHGTDDLMVPFVAAETGWQTLRAAGAALEAHAYPGLGHGLNEDEMDDARTWLAKVVRAVSDGGPGRATGRI